MTKARRARLTKQNLGFLAAQAKWMLRDVEGTQSGRRWRTILEWAQDQIEDAPEEPHQLTNGKEGQS